MAGMKRTTRVFLKQVALWVVLFATYKLVRHYFGWTGVTALVSITIVLFLLGSMIVRKWERHGAIK